MHKVLRRSKNVLFINDPPHVISCASRGHRQRYGANDMMRNPPRRPPRENQQTQAQGWTLISTGRQSSRRKFSGAHRITLLAFSRQDILHVAIQCEYSVCTWSQHGIAQLNLSKKIKIIKVRFFIFENVYKIQKGFKFYLENFYETISLFNFIFRLTLLIQIKLTHLQNLVKNKNIFFKLLKNETNSFFTLKKSKIKCNNRFHLYLHITDVGKYSQSYV